MVDGKTQETLVKPNNKWFVDQIQNGMLIYQHKAKSQQWWANARLQLPSSPHRLPAPKNTILTDVDLVNRREANPTQYQTKKKNQQRFPGTPNWKGYTFNSLDPEEVKNAGRMLLLDVWGDVEYTQSNEQTAERAQELLDKGIVTIERILARGQNEAFATPRSSARNGS